MINQKIKILVVEDDDIDFRILSRHLLSIKSLEKQIDRCTSLSEAYEYCAKTQPDIAIIDHGLSDGTGIDFITKMGGRSASFPCVLLTGHTAQDLDLVALREGAYDYLEKTSLTLSLVEKTIFYAIRTFDSAQELKASKLESERHAALNMRFLSFVGHEMRTPLRSIISVQDILLQSCDDDQRTPITQTKNAAQHMLEFVRNVSEFVRFGQKQAVLKNEVFDVTELLTDVLSLHLGLVEHKSIDLKFTLDDEMPHYYRGDKLRIRQVLVNLISNAIRHTEDGVVEVITTAKNGLLQFSVKDSGCGISPQKLQYLLGSKPIVSSTSNRFDGGLGLGLAICKNIASLMSGQITATSKEDVGSTFTFSFPAEVQKIEPQNRQVS